MENEHELSYETLTRVYLGSYEHYKSVGAEVEHSKPGFELQGAKMDAKRPGEDMCGSYRVMWRGYGMSKEGYGARWSFVQIVLLVGSLTLDNTKDLVSVGPVFLLGLLALAIVAACASRAVAMPLAISCWMAAKVMAGVSDVDDSTEILVFKTSRDKYGDNGMSDPIGGLVFKVDLTGDEDGDTEKGDLTGVSMSLGGEIFLGGKKSQE
ncbi:hypothetical protein Tco_1285610 [Tanacetum coccineum]